LNLPQTTAGLVDEGLFVGNDVGVVNAGQDAHLIEGVLFLLVTEVQHLNFLKGVNAVVLGPAHFVNGGVGSVTWESESAYLVF
jgi:hypothetical protein